MGGWVGGGLVVGWLDQGGNKAKISLSFGWNWVKLRLGLAINDKGHVEENYEVEKKWKCIGNIWIIRKKEIQGK